MEASPEGIVDIFAIVDGSKEVQLKWFAPNKPNGKLTYTALVTGLFYADQGIFFSFIISLIIAQIFHFHFFKNFFSTKFFCRFATPLIIL